MKKTLLTLALMTATVAAFAQGKISFQNDSVHLAYYAGTGTTLDGRGVDNALMPAGVTLVADLYMGTSASALSFYLDSAFGAAEGYWNSLSVLASNPLLLGAQTPFVMAVISDISAPATIDGTQNWAQLTGGAFSTAKYLGISSEFTFKLGSSTTYPVMWNQTSGNWALGTVGVPTAGAGFMGAIAVTPVPEPATLALAGLGIAGLLIFRRRR